MNVRSVLAVGLLAAVVAAGAGGWYVYSLADGFQQPTVESVDNEFGAVTADAATIHSRIVLANPNNRSFPAAATIDYQVRMNGVVVATGTKSGVGLEPGRNTLNLTANFDNTKIPEWWVASINDNGTATVTTTGAVRLPGVPYGVALPEQQQDVDLQLLDVLANSTVRDVQIANSSLLRVSNQRASWGTATAERTPLQVAVDLENVHDVPIQLDGTSYQIRLNDVVVGNGTTTDSLSIAPGETGTFTVNTALDTPRMQDWWVSHLHANESTTFTIAVYGLVEKDGERHEVPLAIYEHGGTFTTDVLGTGSLTLDRANVPAAAAYTLPTVAYSESSWGAVGEETTTIATQATVANPTSSAFDDLVDVRLTQSTCINGIEVATGTATVDGLTAGNATIGLDSEMAHDTVPAWWARHLNAGEQSVITTRTNASVDLGVTTLPLSLPNRTSTVETDVLASMHNDTARTITDDSGRALVTVEQSRASWGTATADRGPLTMTAILRNEQPTPTTIRDIRVTTRLNDITLANQTGEEAVTIAPYETRTIEVTRVLDNTKMAAWWPTHVRNDEESTLETTVVARVDAGGQTERVTFDSLGGNSTITTDLLGQDESDGDSTASN